ncbi:MAG TPA: phenylalanine--tRNA ligase beta subunit-related protein, partial [Patescibacteria group bacterium]|nr:phenylalanine--tRNA ligase beta subunit-related protein [Patescibacteria group bacterium]
MLNEIYKVDDAIFERYPEVKIGLLIGRDVTVGGSDPAINAYRRQAFERATEVLGDAPVTSHPFIASWRNMYRSFGTRPGDYRPSAEALVRRVLKGRGLPDINVAVDAYNAVSVRHLIPMGGFDLNRVSGQIQLRYSGGGEEFNPLGSSGPEETYEGEVVYADDARVLTRRWNFRDCRETMITEDSTDFVMFVDGSPEIPVEVVESALGDLFSLLSACCDGEYASTVVDSG